MSRQYPIWVDVTSCSYQSGKSYGIKETGIQKISIGSSSNNSHLFCTVKIEKRIREIDGEKVHRFRYFFDDRLLKEAFFTDNEGRAGDFIREETFITFKE
jgi:hypothetical protein